MESGRSFSSLSASFFRKTTWTWWPMISTELTRANQMVATLNPPVLSRKHLPTQTFQYHLAPTPLWDPGAVPGEWTDVYGSLKHPNSCNIWKISFTRGLYNSSTNTGPSSTRSKLPPRSMATFVPRQQSLCSRTTKKSRAMCPPQR